jgi:hypothetical protein
MKRGDLVTEALTQKIGGKVDITCLLAKVELTEVLEALAVA